MSWRSFLDALFQRPVGAPSAQSLVFSDDPPISPPPSSVSRKAPSVARSRTNVSEADYTFKDAIRLAALVCDASSSLPILSCVLLSEQRLIATCLDQYLVVQVPELHLPHAVGVPIRQLKELTPHLNGPLSTTLDGETFIVNDRWRIPTLDADEFPLDIAPFRQVVRNEIQLVDEAFPVPEELDALFPAICTDETRIQLCGICFDRPRGALVASNGHVLYRLTGLATGAQQFTVPMEALKIVRFLQRQTAVQAGYYAPVVPSSQKPDIPDNDRDFVCFTIPGVQMWTRLIAVEFPDYPHVFPREDTILARLTLPRAPLIDALSGAVPFLPKKERPDSAKNGALFYSVHPGEGVLHYEATETGDYHVTFPAPGWPVGFYVGLNVRYLLSALKSVPGNPETIEVAFKDDTSPARWAHGAFTAIVMPMRIVEPLPAELAEHLNLSEEPRGIAH